jgi:hypothetical protein
LSEPKERGFRPNSTSAQCDWDSSERSKRTSTNLVDALKPNVRLVSGAGSHRLLRRERCFSLLVPLTHFDLEALRKTAGPQ